MMLKFLKVIIKSAFLRLLLTGTRTGWLMVTPFESFHGCDVAKMLLGCLTKSMVPCLSTFHFV